MGCGKSTVGRLLAEKLGWAFIDTDAEAVRAAGVPVPAIFAERGEDGFRDLEASVLEGLANRRRLVIATGGGIVLREANRTALRDLGFVVWLDVDEETIFRRVAQTRERPLLRTADPRQTVHDLLAARRPLYQATADLTVETSDLSSEEVAYGIKECVEHQFSPRL
jgi:shikimate kinase